MALCVTNRVQHFAYFALVVGIALTSGCTLLFPESGVEAVKDAGVGIDAGLMPDGQPTEIIKASNPTVDAEFGFSVAVSGDILVVGAPGSDMSKGLAYVFVRRNGSWEMEQILKPTGIENGDRFGHSVAVDGTTIVVGANGEDGSGKTIVNPMNLPNNNRSNAGAVFIFEKTDSRWDLRTYLKPPTGSPNTAFGFSVALRGTILAVGEPSEPNSESKGSVYLFKKGSNVGEWTTGTERRGTDIGDRFGHSVALSENYFAVGAPHEDSSSDTKDNSSPKSGAVSIYKLDPGSAMLNGAPFYLKADIPDLGDEFGGVVALSGDLLAVGARFSGTPGQSTKGPGKVYLFHQQDSIWTPNALTPILQASNSGNGDRFGVDIALSDADGTLIVSARQEDGGGKGINPPDDDASENSGAIYVFRRGDGTTQWDQSIYAKAPNAATEDFYGTSVALSASFIFIGARKQDSTVTDSGAVYAILR